MKQPGATPDGVKHDANFEARVAERTEELSSLSTHLLRMMESERSELAKELHDELGGLITAAKMDMAWLQAHIGASLDPAGVEKFHSVVQMLNQAMTLKRRVVEVVAAVTARSLRVAGGIAQPFRRELPARPASNASRRCRTKSSTWSRRCSSRCSAWHRRRWPICWRAAVQNTWNWSSSPKASGYRMTVGDDGAPMDEASCGRWWACAIA